MIYDIVVNFYMFNLDQVDLLVEVYCKDIIIDLDDGFFFDFDFVSLIDDGFFVYCLDGFILLVF